MIKKYRVMFYIDEEQYRQFRSELALSGSTVSGWFRVALAQYLQKAREIKES